MIKQLSSPLVTAAKNIVSSGSVSTKTIQKTQRNFNDFLNFLDIGIKNNKKIKLPSKRELSKISKVNASDSFGNAGYLLSNLIKGKFDVSNFLQRMFPTKGNTKKDKPIITGDSIKFSGIKSLGIINSVFAGLDFVNGLQQGESIGKAAAGAGGFLAGSLLGGAIGRVLVPVPGLGFVFGGLAGGMIGGWTADRIYDATTGGSSDVTQKVSERLKEQEKRQKALKEKNVLSEAINSFNEIVSKLENFVNFSFASMINAASSAAGSKERMMDYGVNPDSIPDSEVIPGELQDMTAEGGQLPSKYLSSPYGWRWGRLHSGVDYATTEGTPVSVIQPGKVTYARFNDGGYGNSVQISHPGGTSTWYGHLSKISVKEGQEITPGTVIGNVGSTGNSTGPHVHFEVRKNNSPTSIPTNEGDKYFRFGGNVKVKPKDGGSLIPQNLGSGSSEQKVMNYLIQQGLTKEQAAGIAGNLKQESGFNPKSGFDGGSHLGIAQWDKDNRWPRISKYIKSIGLDPNTLEGQLAGMVWEAKQRGNWDKIKQKKTSTEAASYWEDKFEGSGDSPGMRGYENRLRYAREIEKSYKAPGVGGPEMSLTPEQIAAYNSGRLSQTANQVQYYPSYSQPQSSVTIMPMIVSSGQQQPEQVPIFIPTGGGGSGTVILPSSPGDVVNSLMKTMLLTNLSGT